MSGAATKPGKDVGGRQQGGRRVRLRRVRDVAAGAPATSPVSAALGRRRLVLLVALLLYLFGLVMVTSATSGTAVANRFASNAGAVGEDQWQFFKAQLIWGVLGMAALLVALRIPLIVVQRLARPMLYVATGLLFLVFLPGLAHSANGATRWISLGRFQLQPSEIVKIAVIIYIADFLSRSPVPRHWVNDFIRSPGGAALGLAAIVFVQRDLGTAMVIGGTVVTMYMLAGTNWRLLFGRIIFPGAALVALGIASTKFRRDRFLAFMDPWHHKEFGYQLVQSLIGIGSGGLFGAGLGHSVQKLHFLPEAHTDMIFAVIAEELGLVGVAVVLVGFASIAVVGTRIALRATDRFQALLAAGLTTALCGQALLNLGGVVGVLPITGVPLPLISYGGSNLLVSLAALGLLANIAIAEHGNLPEDDPESAGA